MSIAILGATGHVGKNLIENMAPQRRMVLYARSIERVKVFLEDVSLSGTEIEIRDLRSFEMTHEECEAIINCIGSGTPEKIRLAGPEQFSITEHYDNLVMDYLAKHPRCTYINFSTGAVYGVDQESPVDATAEFRIPLGSIQPTDAYRISKLNSEAKHRSQPGLSIFDLRLFGFFSRHIDLSSSFLVVEMINAIRERREFVTDDSEIVRDFVHPTDLARLVALCLDRKGYSGALDVYSKMPARKSEIIQCFKERFGMAVRRGYETTNVSPTGKKSHYYSTNHLAADLLGYKPLFSSLECLIAETESILKH